MGERGAFILTPERRLAVLPVGDLMSVFLKLLAVSVGSKFTQNILGTAQLAARYRLPAAPL